MAKCVRPIYLPNREVPVPCGSCGYCLKNRKQDWQFRIANELLYCDSAHFVTLTYSDEYVPVKNGLDVLDKTDLQKFFKRLRKRHSQHSKSQIRYYAVGEYGTQFKRPHYHIILFNSNPKDVEASWPLGFVKFEKVEMGSVGYVVGYVSSIDNDSVSRGVPKQFSLMSKRPALGHMYLHTHGKWHADGLRNYSKVNGIMGRLPRYYKKKMFDKSKLEILTADALQAYENTFNLWYDHFKNNNHTDPAYAVREMETHNEQKIYQNILNSKNHL